MAICPECKSNNCNVLTQLFDWNKNYNCFLNGVYPKCVCKDCGHIFIDNSDIKTIFKEEWLSIKSNKGYTFLHEEKANGKLICVIPYRQNNGNMEYLMRYEICPAHGDEHEFCMIIGSYDNVDLTIEETVVKELREETGYIVDQSKLQSLDWVWDSKVADTKVYLFTIDLTNLKSYEPLTDGTELEKTAYCKWVSLEECYKCKDPKAFVILHKMKEGENK